MNDIIEDYLLGNLSAEEKQTFEKEVASNADLQKEVELHRILITEVQAFNAVQDAEAAYLEQQKKGTSVIEQENSHTPQVNTLYFKHIASIAACFLICISVYKYNIWLQQYTIGIGEAMHMQCHGNIDRGIINRGDIYYVSLIDDKQFNEALEILNQDISRIDDDLLKRADNLELHDKREELLLEKSYIYLLMGKRVQARKILKDLTPPKAQELLDQLHWYSPITNLFKN